MHLEPEVVDYLVACAEGRAVSLSDLVNKLLKNDIEAMKAQRRNRQYTDKKIGKRDDA